MSSRPRALLLSFVLVGASAGVILAHVRLRNPGNGNPLFWSNPGAVGIVIGSAGSDNLASAAHMPALRNAIAAWNAVGDTELRLVEDTDPVEQARTDWQASDLHLVLFDEDDSSGMFPVGSGIVAITPVWFQSSGEITDADVLFNGASYQFTTSGYPQRFDVQDVGAHELGHLVGLDHSGWAGATMYPYVDPSVILHRSLAQDDVVGIRAVYPADFPHGSIQGMVVRPSGGAPVIGAHVAAWDAAGRTAAGTLTALDGSFSLGPLPPGSYTVYARPLDEPVAASNLTSPVTVQTDFGVAFLPAPVAVAAGEDVWTGSLTVAPDSSLNLGKNVDEYPLRVVPGIQVVTIRGSGLLMGATLACSDPAIGVNPIQWGGAWVQTRISVPAGAALGHVDLVVTNGDGLQSVLTAGLEITPRDPLVQSVSPSAGPKAGGSALVILGAYFRPGARVVVGDQVYADGEPGGCTVVDAGRIELTTRPTVAGVHDVVVIDASGVEGRKSGGFAAAVIPVLDGLFPPAGALAGGTSVTVNGADFVPGIVVRIGGVVQADVVLESSTRLRVTTAAAELPGVYDLELENPDGELAQGVFAYWDQPDPALDAILPVSGAAQGGETITLAGTNFTAQSSVRFGVDLVSGAGGVEATSVVFVDSATLAVVTPPFGAGAASVLVQDVATGQGVVADAAFEFVTDPGGGGGGGGGCGTVAVAPGPPRLADVAGGGAALAALFAWLALRAHRARLALASA